MRPSQFAIPCATIAIALSFSQLLSAGTLTVDLVNPSSDGILAEVDVSLDNVTGALTGTFIARAGDFFNGEYDFDLNIGDPSRGTVDAEADQNIAFLDPVATASNASSYTTVTEIPGGPDYDGSTIGWQAGDTIITCGDTDACGDFETIVDSFALSEFVGTLDTSGTLEGPTAAPEPRYWAPLLVLFGGFMLIRRHSSGINADD
jgi:hypothetical protein